MENYEIHQRLGKGAQGSVFLCTSKRDGQKYVLKKVECNDESEANKAFKEAMALEQLTHKYICGYKEFFVHWDPSEETMYVCIVMDYYETGDLENVLKQQRSKEKSLPEAVLKKWFGQMVEALAFVHAKKVIHRDLKPSNIFMTKNLDICLGDFGVATVMNDARTRTRTTVGTMNWMAPEVLERPYDERSDVWSLGCIMLDAATCALLDQPQTMAALFEIKHSSQKLEEVLKEVNKAYSKDLCQTIRAMLRRKFQNRPSAAELIQLPFVRSCLELSKSELVEQDRKRAAPENTVKPSTTKKIPSSIPDIFTFMAENGDRVGCQVGGLEEILRLLATGKYKHVVTPENKAAVIAIMAQYIDNPFVQVAGCQTLQALVAEADPSDYIFQKECIQGVVTAMRSHPASLEVQISCLTLLWSIAQSGDAAAALVGKAGGVHDVLAAMRDNVENEDVARTACGALAALSVSEENAKIATEEQCVQDIGVIFAQHQAAVAVLTQACTALWSLSAEDENIDLVFDQGLIGLIATAIKTHKPDAKFVKQACVALASFVVDEHCAFAMLNNDEKVDGIQAMLDALKAHILNAEVAESVVALIAELAEHDDLKEVLVEKGAAEAVVNVQSKYPDSDEIKDMCDVALKLLSGE